MFIPRLLPLVPADAALPFLVIPLGLGIVAVITLVIVAIEASVLVALGWGPWRASLRDALVANVLSALLGVGLLIAGIIGIPLLKGGASLLVAFVLTVLIEAAYLASRRDYPAARLWRAVVAMNLASYALLSLVYLLFL